MFLILFNLLLIGLYCLCGFIILCIIAAGWELAEKIINRKPVKIKKRIQSFVSYDLSEV